MDPASAALAAATLAAAAALQGAVGFGLGLFSIPLLLRLGLDLHDAVALAVGASTAQNVVGVWRGRAWIRPALSLRVGVAQWLGIPLGVALVVAVADLGPDVLKRAVGAAVLLAVALRAVAAPTPRPEVPRRWAALAGVTSGVLGGSVGMGGPPLVLLALAHDWPKDRFRVFLWSQFLLSSPAVVALLAWRWGAGVLGWWALGVGLGPLIWLGSAAGARGAAGWDDATLQRAAAALLAVIGVTGLLGI